MGFPNARHTQQVFRGEIAERIEIAGHDVQQEIDIARHRIAGNDFRPLQNRLLKTFDRRFGMIAEPDFLDYLFGTAVKSDEPWPQQYGVKGDYMPDGFWRQLLFPFTWKG